MMKNPLNRRFLRELRSDFGKYLVIFVLMVLSISEVSGFLVAGESMIAAYDESFEKYSIEDGNFTVGAALTEEERQAVEALGVRLTELFYREKELASGSTVRIFKNRQEMNLACVMSGSLPEKEGEIAIDRMFADNNGIRTGDVLKTDDISLEVTGLVALSDYSTMFSDNNDLMFDALKFGVGVVTPEQFDALSGAERFRYAWQYTDGRPADRRAAKEKSDEFMKGLSRAVDLTGYVPGYLNQAITFAGEDMGSDRVMMMIFLYIVIVIIAFVFGVTISSTIAAEATVIGTLRASGFTKRELIRHYMTMPVIVTLISAAVGNILGYTLLKNVNAGLYYNSYSLPTYVTRWSASAFVETTVVPIVLMLVIDYVILRKRLALSPLKFIRRDLKTGRQRKPVKLPAAMPFFDRFRMRVVLQNLPNYLLLLAGVFFANVLLLFGMMFPALLRHYEETIPDQMLADYQYVLQLPAGMNVSDLNLGSVLQMLQLRTAVETENKDAEKFSAYGVRTLPDGLYAGEEVLVYGIAPGSRYVDLEMKPGDVYVSSAFAEKLQTGPGKEITVGEEYSDATYTFTVTGIFDYGMTLCLFMPMDDLNEVFGLGKGMFAGYFSSSPIEDIDERYVGQVIDVEAMTKVSRQLTHSMGGMMKVVDVFAVVMFMILIYLLSKTIIEKNAQSISMAKILGYTSGEISRLYLTPTTLVVIGAILVTIPLVAAILTEVVKIAVRAEMKGWLPIWLDPKVFAVMIALGIGTYVVVAALEYRKIRSIPMEEALKGVE